MKTYLKSFLCAFSACLLLSLAAYGQTKSNCKEIKAEIEVTDTSGGLSNGIIKVTKKESNQDIKIHLLKVGNPDENKYNLETLEIENLDRGEYDVVITEESGKNYCPKLERIKVN